MDVTINSRATIITTAKAEINLSPEKQISTDEISILSARGSIIAPKAVIVPFLRAILPSRWSVYEAIKKITKAHVNL